MSTTPLMIKLASFNFGLETRADFYVDFAQTLKASPGTPITEVFDRYAKRYKKDAIGILSKHWLEKMRTTGMVSEAMRGTIPNSDHSVIATAEKSGNLTEGLLQLSINAQTAKAIKSDISVVLGVAIAMILMLHIYFYVQSFTVITEIARAVNGRVDLAQAKGMARLMLDFCDGIRSYWWLILSIEIGLVAWIKWSLPNYVGTYRSWLDKHIFIYQVYRDINGASLLMNAASLTKMQGSTMMKLTDALLQIRDQTTEPWTIWQINLIRSNLYQNPENSGEIFNTGITSQKLYYRILDMSDSQQLDTVLNQISKIILEVSPNDIKKRSYKIRYLTVAICLVLMLTGYFSTLEIVNQIKQLIQMKLM